jgi:hypothetical protein
MSELVLPVFYETLFEFLLFFMFISFNCPTHSLIFNKLSYHISVF